MLTRMNRLDNIITRNRRGGRFNERTGTMILVGLFMLAIIGLAAFTDLGRTADEQDPAPAAPHEKSIHVPLARPRSH